MSVSDNDAASLMLDGIGQDRISNALNEIGAQDTDITIGFSDPELVLLRTHNMTTAADVARILEYLQQHDSPVLGMMNNNLFGNRIPALLGDTVQVAHKTGSLPGICNDAGIIFSSEDSIIAVFLCSNLQDRPACEAQIGKAALEIVRASDLHS